MVAAPIRWVPIALAVLWGLNWPAIRIALTAVPPWSLRAVGLGCGAALLFLAARWLGRSFAIRREMRARLLVAGLLNIAVFNLATTFAQLATTTSRAAVLTFTMPLWSALLARAVLGERLDRTKAIALAVGMLGLALLAIPVLAGGGSAWGMVFPLVAAWGWAAGTVFQKWKPIQAEGLVATA